VLASTALSNVESGIWKPLVAFVHIPRTGGGSVKRALARAYGRAQSVGNVQFGTEKSEKLLQRVGRELDTWSGRVLAGFVPYGLFARYLPPDTRYVTFLRDPVERVLSHHYAHAQGGPEELRTAWRRDPAAADGVGDEDDLSLEAGLKRGITIYNNLATRFLWGGESLDGALPADALEQARANLDRFAFVGVTERLDEGMILLSRVLCIQPAGYPRRHVTQSRPTADEIPPSLARLIEEHNALDIELYRTARERFENEEAAAGDLGAQVEELRLQQAAAVEEAEAERVARKAARREQRQATKRGIGGTGDLEAGELRAELTALEHRLQAIEGVLGIVAEQGKGPRPAKKRPRGDRPKKRRRDGGPGADEPLAADQPA
jgi:hypothetical protein